MLCCIVLASCKNEADMLQTLNDLKKELAQTNDTLIGYSLKEDYALWIHEDEPKNEKSDEPDPGKQTLYKCTLSDGERTKFFTTDKDSIKVLINDDKHVTIDRITNWKFTPDSLALIIEDGWNGRYFFTYMMPLNKDFKGVYDMGMDGIPEKINCDSIPVYVTYDLIETRDIDGYGDITWNYVRKYAVSSDGSKKIANDYATIYPNTATSGFDEVKVRTSLHDTPDDIKHKFLENLTIKIKELKEVAKNQVKFEKTFEGKRCLFDCEVENMTYDDSWSGNRTYNLGVKDSKDDFSSLKIKTTDPNAAKLEIHTRVIIAADVRYHRYWLTDEPEIKFENAKIIYSEPIKGEQ